MDIQIVQLGDEFHKAVNGHIYPVNMPDGAIVQLETLLSQKGYVKVQLDILSDPWKLTGFLCVHQSSHKVGLSSRRGVMHAIAPIKRTDIINIIADGKLVYTESLDGI